MDVLTQMMKEMDTPIGSIGEKLCGDSSGGVGGGGGVAGGKDIYIYIYTRIILKIMNLKKGVGIDHCNKK